MTSVPKTLRLASYNIRFDNPGDPFPWSARRGGLADLLVTLGADVFGLQEVLAHQLGDLSTALPAYRYVGIGRGPNPGNRLPYTSESGEYNPIFFRHDHLRLLESGTFWLSPTPHLPGSSFPNASHPRIATWAQLELRDSHHPFFVFNTHFPFEQDTKGEAARAASANVLLEHIARLAGDHDVLLTGDFNLTTQNEADRMQTYAPLRATFQDALEAARSRKGPGATFFGFETTNPGENRIDYIFASSRVEIAAYEARLAHNGRFYYSDHAPIICDLVFSLG